jgi:hypothetical protein
MVIIGGRWAANDNARIEIVGVASSGDFYCGVSRHEDARCLVFSTDRVYKRKRHDERHAVYAVPMRCAPRGFRCAPQSAIIKVQPNTSITTSSAQFACPSGRALHDRPYNALPRRSKSLVNQDLLSTADVARALHQRDLPVSETTIRVLADNGQIPAPRLLGNRRVWEAEQIPAIETAIRTARAGASTAS